MIKNKKKTLPISQVDKTHYYNLRYDSKERWISYWHQIDEIMRKNPRTVLEIGVGNKTVSDHLKNNGLSVTTCDLDESLNPDVVASVTKLPFKNNSFDMVLCAEVLEHLRFNQTHKGLKEIYRITKKFAVISLPHFSITNFYFGFKFIPYLPRKEFMLKLDFPLKHEFLGEHFWEIGKKGYPLKRIKEVVKKTGFIIERSFYPKENPRHHFFILRK